MSDLKFTFSDGTKTFIPIENSAAAHNAIYRGNDLTSYFDSGEMSTAIAAGTFADIFPGDYITKSVTVDGTTYDDVKWLVAHCDYFYRGGSTELTTHHVVLISESGIGTAKMNSSNDTTGAYVGSAMWTTTIPLYATGITAAFGAAHVLTHTELLANAISATADSAAGAGYVGTVTGWEWPSVTCNIPNEVMIYGTMVFSSSAYDVGDCTTQLALFGLNKTAQFQRQNIWLRAVCSSSNFCALGSTGLADRVGASYSLGVRPYFLLI